MAPAPQPAGAETWPRPAAPNLPNRQTTRPPGSHTPLRSPAPRYSPSQPTYSIRPPRPGPGSSLASQTPPSIWVRRPVLGPLPAGHRRRQRAGAQSAVAHPPFFFFPSRYAFLNNLALFEHTGVNNGHQGKRLLSKRMRQPRQAGLRKAVRCTGRSCEQLPWLLFHSFCYFQTSVLLLFSS